MAALGFLFWIVCARLYPSRKVGTVTSLVSAAALATTFSSLGFSNTLIRFLPEARNRNRFITTAMTLTTVASIIVGIVFFYFLRGVASNASGAHSLWIIAAVFIVYVAILTFNSMLDSVLIAYRSARRIFLKNSLMSVIKVGLPFALVSFGLAGILGSIVLALAIAVLYGTLVLIKSHAFRFVFRLDDEALTDARGFAAGNYVGTIFSTMPATLVPLVVLSRLGASTAAFFYMPMMIVTFLNVVPSASAQSLFAEVSNDFANIEGYLYRSVRAVFAIMIPVAILIVCIAPFVLELFGHAYAREGATPLRILTLGSVVGALNYLGDSLLNMKKLVRMYVFMNIFNAAAVVGTTYLLVDRGLDWVALGWLIGQTITVVVYLAINWSTVTATRSPPRPGSNRSSTPV
jgi:O-antigen/teichoic acid export membrane protein